MHQLDIQDIDGQLYYVYDGNRLKNNDTQLYIKAVLKMNFLDFKQWLKNL
jgi:hypothetical protein